MVLSLHQDGSRGWGDVARIQFIWKLKGLMSNCMRSVEKQESTVSPTFLFSNPDPSSSLPSEMGKFEKIDLG